MKTTAEKNKTKRLNAKTTKNFSKIKKTIRGNLKTIIPTLATIAVGARLLQRRAENFVK